MKNHFPSEEEKSRMAKINKKKGQVEFEFKMKELQKWISNGTNSLYYEIRQMNEYQVRLKRMVDGLTIDWYPKTNKYHNITDDSRGLYTLDALTKRITSGFTEKQELDTSHMVCRLVLMMDEFLPSDHIIFRSSDYKKAKRHLDSITNKG